MKFALKQYCWTVQKKYMVALRNLYSRFSFTAITSEKLQLGTLGNLILTRKHT